MKSIVLMFSIFFQCQASILTPTNKIVGGEAVEIDQFPYQVAVLDVNDQICGGTIVSSKWILTAAHCTDDTIPRYLTVRVGSSFHQHGGVVHQVDFVVQYEGHDPYGWLRDFALLHLETDIKYGYGVQPVQLAASELDVDFNVDCWVSGWGTTQNASQNNDQLRATTVRLISREECNRYYDGKVDNTMVCAGDLDEGHDSCQGDSGGPLVCSGRQVGIVSWGRNCGQSGYPGVYAYVVFARNWIKEVTGY